MALSRQSSDEVVQITVQVLDKEVVEAPGSSDAVQNFDSQVDDHDLVSLLRVAAARGTDSGRLTFYPLGDTASPSTTSYAALLALAERHSQAIKQIPGFAPGAHVLLHFEDHFDIVVWLWSTLIAGAVPALSTPLSLDPEERGKHLLHLSKVLDPIVITKASLLPLFDVCRQLKPLSIEQLERIEAASGQDGASQALPTPSTALIMLTSGSTGHSKAVPLSHQQVFTAVRGKAAAVRDPSGTNPYLNWISLDHVGSLVEIHMLAMYLQIGQIHVRAPDVIADPLTLLRLCDRHRVNRTFAPNSFLQRLSQELTRAEGEAGRLALDLSCLQTIISGGEANVVETGVTLSAQLSRYGTPANVITPGFGMTETCAGSIYNVSFPRNDAAKSYEYASLGTCIPGMEIRIVPGVNQEQDQEGRVTGELQLHGPGVFKGYLNNPTANAEAFTEDGWFRTGDQAFINEDGHLKLIGRTKDTLVINGVKYLPSDLEYAIEKAEIKGVTQSYVVCFSYREGDASTEGICLIYLPTYAPDDHVARTETERQIVTEILLRTGCRPYVLPLGKDHLRKTSLGKLSRQKLKVALQEGRFREEEALNAECLAAYRAASQTAPTTATQILLLETINSTLTIELSGIDTSFFEIGFTSIDLIQLRAAIEKAFSISSLSFTTLISNPTVRTLAEALDELQQDGEQAYDPVVPLRTEGSKAPLWLVHPGVGEVLVFLSLASKIKDRPVYALRARGFNGEEYFADIDDAVHTYHTAIKRRQPIGPYAIAGYSYGSMLAFEVTKVLEHNGDEVRFLGAFNLPPHIKYRMRQLDWIYGLLHLSYFLRLITEEHAVEAADRLRAGSRELAVAHIADAADRARLVDLQLTIEQLVQWTNLSSALQSMATDYEPAGTARSMDVFIAIPLKAVSPDRKDWRENHLNKWMDFIPDVRYHDVDGSHYTMIAPENVDGFWSKLQAALEARGV